MTLYELCNSIIMGDSNQGNDKSKERIGEKYETWTVEETNELLKFVVDFANQGWRDNNGLLSDS